MDAKPAQKPSWVSIPSRRVGDVWCPSRFLLPHLCFHPLKAGRRRRLLCHRGCMMRLFPSPQGGSETRTIAGLPLPINRFPSPQGGSETGCRVTADRAVKFVSIPSRRVGDDLTEAAGILAAGVSIPSRRVGDLHRRTRFASAPLGFHPLKAGRRQPCRLSGRDSRQGFPSPQGGSETQSL